jgi:two-component system, OmpR family, response regulator
MEVKVTTRCLVVDDDLEIRGALADYLQGFGMQVAAAADGVQMRRLMSASAKFDIVILDLMLPGEDGLSLCRWIQAEHGVPVIMLTAHGDPASRVVGLEMGADDYLGKPFEPRELVARIHSVLRRANKSTDASQARLVRFADWRFDRVARQLISADDVVMPLSAAEYRLLSALTERAGRVLTREQLIEATRAPGVEVNDRSIDLAVSRLRGKLGDTAREAKLIVTVRGEGYLFDVPVSSAT